MSDRFPILTGPTAAGKTALAIDVARALGGEIISADSRQIYRELCIGAAKPSREELALVRHHFIDELSVAEHFTAGMFAERARALIDRLVGSGTVPVITGGSTLYVHALMYGLDDIPVVEPSIREATEADLESLGSRGLHAELERVDPDGAAQIEPTRSHRVARALAVFRATGRPISSFFTGATPDPRFALFIVTRERSSLYSRIDRRVDEMVAGGLVDEVRRLFDSGLDLRRAPMRTIGYRELFEHFEGRTSLDEAVRLIKRNTRRYAKRQLTWYRRYPEAIWLDAAEPAPKLLGRIQDALSDVHETRPDPDRTKSAWR